MDYPVGPYSKSEADVPAYTLPELLASSRGRVDSAWEWMNYRRREVLDILKKECFGEILPRPDSVSVELLSEKSGALNGIALRRELRITFAMNNGRSHSFIMLLYLPLHRSGGVPVFLGLNFKGNHNTTPERDIIPTGGEYVEKERHLQTGRWCFEDVLRRGYASATICYHDIHPDRADGTAKSVFSLFFAPEKYSEISKKYSVIGAWAWGLSRAADVLRTMPEIDGSKIIVHGHSRLGKTALWAGAADQRFAMIIANNSGCGGAALHRRKFGENLSQHFEAHLQRDLPVWFVDKLREYIGKEENLPFDSHYLLALAAPRPLCVASATEDLGADPKGEMLGCAAASEVYELFGNPPFGFRELIPPDTNVPGTIHYHLRTGKHDQTPHDWRRYLDAADKYFKDTHP